MQAARSRLYPLECTLATEDVHICDRPDDIKSFIEQTLKDTVDYVVGEKREFSKVKLDRYGNDVNGQTSGYNQHIEDSIKRFKEINS